MSIKARIQEIQQQLKTGVTLVAVSKFQPVTSIEEAYQTGQRVFGENRLQELQEKVSYFEQKRPDIHWHFIGHVQSKKVKTILPLVDLIHAVDSEKLYDQVLKDAQNLNITARILLQVHIAQEETKFGFSEAELIEFAKKLNLEKHQQVRICGLMGMASFTDNQEQVRKEFRSLKTLFGQLKTDYFADSTDFCELSMGMSNDYTIAMEEGATIIRVGSNIFGARQY